MHEGKTPWQQEYMAVFSHVVAEVWRRQEVEIGHKPCKPVSSYPPPTAVHTTSQISAWPAEIQIFQHMILWKTLHIHIVTAMYSLLILSISGNYYGVWNTFLSISYFTIIFFNTYNYVSNILLFLDRFMSSQHRYSH